MLKFGWWLDAHLTGVNRAWFVSSIIIGMAAVMFDSISSIVSALLIGSLVVQSAFYVMARIRIWAVYGQ